MKERVIVRQFQNGSQGLIRDVDEFHANIQYVTCSYPDHSSVCTSRIVKKRTFPVVEYNGIKYSPRKEKHEDLDKRFIDVWTISLPSMSKLPHPLYKDRLTPIEITIRMEGGVIQNVELPQGKPVRVTIIDPDTEGCDVDDIKQMPDGTQAYVVTYETPCYLD